MFERILIDSIVRSMQMGSLYALMALGITLTMSVIKLPNFAHAEYITVGAYTAMIVSRNFSANPVIVLTLSALVASAVALASHVLVFRSFEKQKSSIYIMLLASFAVGLIIRYVLFLAANTYDLFDLRINVPLVIWYRTDNLILTNVFFWIVPTSLVLVIVLSALLNYTPLGREMRALADNFDLARVIGIPVERVKWLTWLLVGALAGVSGALLGIQTSVSPLMGWITILSVFAAAILGGLSSFPGTILGAYLVAFSENTIMQLLNYQYGLDFSFKPAIPFLIIVIVLLIRPEGFTQFFKSNRSLKR